MERIRDLPRKVTDYPWVILTEHLYGVDIDGEAAEIATLNLVMRAFRELRSLGRHEEKLPLILNQNIKVGNSLVPVVNASLEEYALARQTHLTRLMTMRRQIAESRDEEEQRRVVSEFEYLVRALPQNLLERFGVEGADALPTFDWFGEFPEVWFQADGSPRLHPGFDVVVGNPPYIRIQRLRQAFPVEADIYRRLYQSARGGSYDIYVLFVERGLSLLSRAGRLGYIMPSRFFKAEYGAAGRKLIADRQHVEAIVDFGANQVFAGATTYTALLFLTASEAASYRYCRVRDLEMWRATRGGRVEVLDSATLSGKPWVFALGPGGELFRRLDAWSPKFGDAADLFVGVQTSADAVFILEYLDSSQDYVRLRSKSLQADVEMERAAVRPIVSGEDVGRYEELSAKHWVLFPYDVENEVPALIPIDEIHARWPLAGRYLDLNRATLESRERGAFRDANWHRFGRNQNIGIQFRPKLCVPRLVVRLGAALDRNGAFVLDNVDVGGLTLKAAFADHSPEYVVALLNSSLLNQQFRHVTIPYRGEWLSANRQFIDPLPFRPIKFADPQEAVLHDQIVELVHEIIANRARLRELVLEPADELTSRVAELESAVDEIVEALFDLTVEEKSVLHPPRDGLR